MFRFQRLLTLYAVAIPLALMLGWLAATPDSASIAMAGFIVFVLAIPLLMQHSHWLLILTWNSAFILGFLPGHLPFWTLFAFLAFGIGLVHSIMSRRPFLRVPQMTKPLVAFGILVLLTARVRGGLGIQSLGGASFGGKNYFFLLISIIGYFGLVSQPVPIMQRVQSIRWFFLSALSYGLVNVGYLLGSTFYFIYLFIDAGMANTQVMADYSDATVRRYGGLGPAAIGLLAFVISKWGIIGILRWSKPWRFLLFSLAWAAALFSGFRSELAFVGLFFVIQFFVEGLWKTAWLPIFCSIGILCAAPMLLFLDHMPRAIQRTLEFLHLPVDPTVREEAEESSQWRFDMWRATLAEAPQYLWVGKCYSIDPTELYLATEAARTGALPSYEVSRLSGDFHSGPLSILIPFGLPGVAVFLWMIGAGLKVLYSNFRYGEAQLKPINGVMFSYFLTQAICFFFVFGALSSQLSIFLGAVGFSVSLNRGVCRRAVSIARAPSSPPLTSPVAVT